MYKIKNYLKITIGLLLLLLVLFGYLKISESRFESYNDSQIRKEYSKLLNAFEDVQQYHLKYKTSAMRGGQVHDIYYKKDTFYAKSFGEKDSQVSISFPTRTGMGYIREKDYDGDCEVTVRGSWPRKTTSPCLLEAGFVIPYEEIPADILLNDISEIKTRVSRLPGKIYFSKKLESNNELMCFSGKTSKYIINPDKVYFKTKSKFLSDLSKIIPRVITEYGTMCYSKSGVLTKTSRNEKLISISYDSVGLFLEDIPYYSDFQKFLNKSNVKNEILKIEYDNSIKYFKDMNNYLDFITVNDEINFLIGCNEGIRIGDNETCSMSQMSPYSWNNLSFYPLKFVESKLINSFEADCFEYKLNGLKVAVNKEFCILEGGIVVSEKEHRTYKTGSGPEETGFVAKSISIISNQEYASHLQDYLASSN